MVKRKTADDGLTDDEYTRSAWPWGFKAWDWLKRNWKWLILPVGVLIWLVARWTARKEVIVTSTALAEHDETMEEINAEAAAKVELADQKAAEQLAGIDAAQSAAVTEVHQHAIKDAAEAQGNPEKVNEFLLDVGKDMRK